MRRKTIIQEILGIWLLFTGCLIGGLMLNEMRAKPLAWVYASPQSRLAQSIDRLGSPARISVSGERDVTTAEMQSLSATNAAVILDARPDIFYRLGHIPAALSLPRDDFEKQYQVLRSSLLNHRTSTLVVYCSSSDCHDSQMVADALQKLGYRRVRLYRGGWTDWVGANLPEEKEP